MTSPQKPRATTAQKQAVRDDYLLGRGALHVLARQHGLPVSTVQRWSRQEHWLALRDEHTAVRLGKLCPSRSPRVPLPVPLEIGDNADAMEKRRAMALRVVEEQIRQLLDRQKEEMAGESWLAISRALGEHSERLLKMAGLIPRPVSTQSRRKLLAAPVPDQPGEG